MKAAKNGATTDPPDTPRSRTRQTYRDTIKIEKDKIKEINRKGIEPWRKEELIKPIQKRLDRWTAELDEFNRTQTPTFKGGGKMKPIKKK